MNFKKNGPKNASLVFLMCVVSFTSVHLCCFQSSMNGCLISMMGFDWLKGEELFPWFATKVRRTPLIQHFTIDKNKKLLIFLDLDLD